MISAWWAYMSNGENWSGKSGLWANIIQHISYSVVAIAIAAVIAVPLGLWIGHTGRGSTLVVGTVNASRALPTFGIMVLLYIWIAPHFTGKTNLPYILPVEFVLLLLAIPPLLSNTYAGVQSVDPAMRDAAYGMGMTGWQVLVKVELPNAFPLMMSGLRASTLQVVATATIGAYIGLGGLGAPIYEGTQQGPFQDTPQSQIATGELLSGAFLVAALALALDLILATIQRYSTSRGITGRYRKSHLPGPANAVIENSDPDGGPAQPTPSAAMPTEAPAR